MDTQTAETARKLSALDALAANYGAELNENLKLLWLDLLEAYSAEHVRSAVKIVIERYEYKTLPPFAVLKKALDELSGTGEKALELQAIAEWGILDKAIEDVGYYGAPKFHPTTAHVVRLMGGWGAVCNWFTKDLDFKRRDFIDLWINSHGRVEYMELGAGAVQDALQSGCDARHIGTALQSVVGSMAGQLGAKQ